MKTHGCDFEKKKFALGNFEVTQNNFEICDAIKNMISKQQT